MFKNMFIGLVGCIILLGFTNLAMADSGASAALTKNAPVRIVAAENFYGALAKEIGGNKVEVQSIISNPNADPHLFTTTPKITDLLNNAQIIIYNGDGYDAWMDEIFNSLTNRSVLLINVSSLMKVKNGDNPHIWYNPETMAVVAKQIAQLVALVNHQAKLDVNKNLALFLNQNKQVLAATKQIKAQYSGVPVTATEPVYGYMANAMGLNMQGTDFQMKMMNGTEPSPQMLAAFESEFLGNRIKVLFYNNQVTNPVSKNILDLAKARNVPVVGISETMPVNMGVNAWLLDGINKTEQALKLSKGSK